MARAVPTAAPPDTAQAILDALRGGRFDSAQFLYVLGRTGELVGVVSLADLFAAPPTTTAGELMQPSPPAVHADVDREQAASLAIREEVAALTLGDEHGRFLGVLPPRAMVKS